MAKKSAENLQYTIVALGDSVTDGCLEPGKKNFETVYHARLKKKLNILFPSLRINMINSGIGGINTPNTLPRMERDVFDYSPDLVIVCLGLNDIWGGKEKYLGALGSVFALLRDRGVPAVYMTPNMTSTSVDREKVAALFGGSERYADLAEELKEKQLSGETDELFASGKALAKEYGVTVCDCYAAWRNLYDAGVDVTELLCNRINHPVPEMHELFASMLFAAIVG